MYVQLKFSCMCACAYMGEVAACLACRAGVAVPLSTVYTTITASLIVASVL